MIEGSIEFSNLHQRAMFGQSPKLKMNKETFRSNSEYAHLIGRAFTCEKILKQHAIDPYKTVDELLGDLQVEIASTLNNYRKKTAYRKMPVLTVEDFIIEETQQ